MKIQVEVSRSSEWVLAQRLARGENVSRDITVAVEVSELSEGVRRILLTANGGEYPAKWVGGFNKDYEFTSNTYCPHGYQRPIVDSDTPTTAEIDAAIIASSLALGDKRQKHEEEKRQRAEKERQEKEEQRRRADELARARELLKDELAQGEQWRKDRAALAEFLSAIPDDALRGTLKAVAHNEKAIADLRKRVEDASPVVIFSDDDSDE